MPGPTFIVIGGQKCGTTWLSRMLGGHPDVFTPRIKELKFFDRADNFAKGISWYEDFFGDRRTEKAAGEFTPNYLWTIDEPSEATRIGRNPNIPQLVHRHYPDVRLVVSLRDQVDRAVSAYFHHIRDRRVRPNQRLSEVWNRFGILSMGYYADHLRRWFDFFPQDRFLICFYETDLRQMPTQTLRKVFRHIGVNDRAGPQRLDRDSFLLSEIFCM